MKVDSRKQAVTAALFKDNSADWKHLADQEIAANEKLKEKISELEKSLLNQEKGHVLEIEPLRCRNWKYADRNSFELGDIEALAEDIQQHGQVQPAIVRKIAEPVYDYEIIAGERRWRACLLAKIPLKALVTKEDDMGCLVIQTSENKKKSLSAYSLALSYHSLMLDLKISQNELSRRLNIPKTSFSELLSFTKVPKVIWEEVGDMSQVKPRTAAFLALTSSKGPEYLSAILKLTSKIREGYGSDNLIKLIDKLLMEEKTERDFSQEYKGKSGTVLFKMNKKGKISLAKEMLEKINLDDLARHLSAYLEA